MTTTQELLTLLRNQVNSLLKQKANAVENGDLVLIQDIEAKIEESENIINKLS